MPNEIITTLSSSIASMQLNLFDFVVEKPKFDEVLTRRFQRSEITRNVNKNLNLLSNNHFEYLNPICPNCNSNHVIKQEYHERNPILADSGPQKIYLRRYKCKSCSKKFTTSLDSVIKPHHRYVNIYSDKLESLIQTGYRSLRKLGEDFQTFFGNSPSHTTIKKWQTIEVEKRITNTITLYSGYYAYDEQYIRLNGKRHYRLTLYDTILNIPIAEEIAPKRTTETIKRFIEESTKNQPLIAITTDHFRRYKRIMDKISVKHQLCIFHLFKMIGNSVHKILKSKNVSKREKITLCLYFTDIKNIFRTYNEETSINRLETLLDKFKDIPKVLQRYLTKKILPDFQRLTHFMRSPFIQRTSNKVENYYRQTDPNQIKKIYKTIKGILSYLNQKMKKWTAKHGKNINTQ
ncbi:transposase [Methanobacterium sp. YSL]|nr:transposase [Methanobacterium sp. YSL]MBW4256485.1 transposase [Methanobacterium sp. YSL]MBW4256944.1 transposase [Methanobacterium sp. YSL]MBW4256960.1 transposase [Methanobacterium sp. YSL]